MIKQHIIYNVNNNLKRCLKVIIIKIIILKEMFTNEE